MTIALPSLMRTETPVHCFTVDVEEHFHAHALSPWVPETAWADQTSRVDGNTRRLLDLMEARQALGTFFILGWVAKRLPDLVKTIAARGHEIASHGWWHRRVQGQEPEEFRLDVRDSRAILEDLSGTLVLGYRAPSFSIVEGSDWAYDVLLEEGYRYDSSCFPIRRSGYGSPDSPRVPHRLKRPSGELLELPLATLEVAGLRIPGGGGNWFRQLPYGLTHATFAQQGRQGLQGIFYIHPWEYDTDQPVYDVSWVTRQRHYGGLNRTWGRLDRLLRDFRFQSIASRLDHFEAVA